MKHPDESGGRPPHLQHHFVSAEQQASAAKLGMWIFLVTEILMFSGLFVAYTAARYFYPGTFLHSHEYLSVQAGAINTFFLITSSLTMAIAVRAAQTSNQKALVINLLFTLAFAAAFMVVKYIEYTHKFHDCLLPGPYFNVPNFSTASCSEHAAHLLAAGGQPQLFFGIYFAMTGLHGLHVLIGMGLIVWLILISRSGRFSSEYYTPVENVGLYWHLVDLIWIFLFPLLYLVR